MKGNLRIALHDASILLLTIGSLAFGDIDIICIGSQFLAIGITVFRFIQKPVLDRYILYTIYWIVAFAGYCMMSGLWASSKNTTVLSTSISFIQAGLIILCVLYYCDSKERVIRFIRFLIVTALIICVRFVLTVPVSQWGDLRTGTNDESIFTDNSTAMILAYVSIIVLWEFFIFRNTTLPEKIIAIGICAVFMLLVLLMGTKKGLLIFAVGATVLYISQSKSLSKSLLRIGVIVIVAVVFYYYLMNVPLLYQVIGERIEQMLNGLTGEAADASTRTRMEYYQNAIDEFAKHPIIGLGMDGFRYVNQDRFTYSHNNYSELLANLGIIGFSLYYSIFGVLIVKALYAMKKNILPLIILAIRFITDIGLVSYESESDSIWLAVVIFLLCVDFEKDELADKQDTYGDLPKVRRLEMKHDRVSL